MVLNYRMYYIITICYMGFSEQNHGPFTSRAKKSGSIHRSSGHPTPPRKTPATFEAWQWMIVIMS